MHGDKIDLDRMITLLNPLPEARALDVATGMCFLIPHVYGMNC